MLIITDEDRRLIDSMVERFDPGKLTNKPAEMTDEAWASYLEPERLSLRYEVTADQLNLLARLPATISISFPMGGRSGELQPSQRAAHESGWTVESRRHSPGERRFAFFKES